MKNSSISLFGQILQLVPKADFNKIIQKHNADKYKKGFNCWSHFVSMLFCQMAQAKSLREICKGLKCCLGKLNHLGNVSAPSRSNLSYANKNRPCEIYESLFYKVLSRCKSAAPRKKRKFRFKNKLYSMDASIIDLCLSMFDWAKFRQTKGAVKLHLLLDHDGYLPVFLHISDGKTHEVNIAHDLTLPAGSVIAIDRGYNDYSLFHSWTTQKIWFVTRLKSNAAFRVVKSRPIPKNRNIVSDEIIEFTGIEAVKKCPSQLRRIVVYDELKNRNITLLTNHMKFGASTVSAIYRDRWEIEVFFKYIKQNLKIKTFVGTSANAVKIQIWTALIAILLLKYLQFKARKNWSLSNLVALLRWNLFSYRHLWKWLDDPYETPPEPPPDHPLLPLFETALPAN